MTLEDRKKQAISLALRRFELANLHLSRARNGTGVSGAWDLRSAHDNWRAGLKLLHKHRDSKHIKSGWSVQDE